MLAKIDITSANLCLSQYRTNPDKVSPSIQKLKFDVLSLDRDEFFDLTDCDIRELTVYYEDFLRINKVCISSDIESLYLLRCDVDELSIDLTHYRYIYVDDVYAYLVHILSVIECNINTIRIRLKPGTDCAQFQYNLDVDFARAFTKSQNIIIE